MEENFAFMSPPGETEVLAKRMADGSLAVSLFNRSRDAAAVTAQWSDLKIVGQQSVRDLWRRTAVGTFDGQYKATMPSHGVVLVRITPSK